jgi:hypothetical protein
MRPLTVIPTDSNSSNLQEDSEYTRATAVVLDAIGSVPLSRGREAFARQPGDIMVVAEFGR